jgi:hypothetical protein
MFKYKVDVSKGGSKEVQLHAFSLGYFWEFDQCKLDDRFSPCHLTSHYLYFNKDGSIWYSDDCAYFKMEREHMLISVENFRKLTKK